MKWNVEFEKNIDLLSNNKKTNKSLCIAINFNHCTWIYPIFQNKSPGNEYIYIYVLG